MANNTGNLCAFCSRAQQNCECTSFKTLDSYLTRRGELLCQQKPTIANHRNERQAKARAIVGGPYDPVTNDYIHVYNAAQVIQMVQALAQLPRAATLVGIRRPWMGIDLETYRIADEPGYLSYLQIADYQNHNMYLVDLYVLQGAAWTSATAAGVTLRTILEAADIPKLILDTRQDSLNLRVHAQIRLRGMIDLQILHFLNCTEFQGHRASLEEILKRYARLTPEEFEEWRQVKTWYRGEWHARPTVEGRKLYAIQDVTNLYRAWEGINGALSDYARSVESDITREQIRDTWTDRVTYSIRFDGSTAIHPSYGRYWREAREAGTTIQLDSADRAQIARDAYVAWRLIEPEEPFVDPSIFTHFADGNWW